MRAKGTAVKATPKFIRERFPDRYDEWFASLSERSQKIFSNPIMSNEWYNIKDAIIEPTKMAGFLFFESTQEAAFELGVFSAFDSLKGIYKAFVRIASINFVIKRAPTIFSTYYDRGRLEIIKNMKNFAVLRLSQLDEANEIILFRVAGWIAAVPEVIGKKRGEVEFSKKLDGQLLEVIFSIKWED